MKALALLLILVATPALAQEREGATHELSYELKARVRSFVVDADLWAGARLSFRSAPAADGSVAFELDAPIDHPWKFYWVSPAIGREEAKFANIVTLAEPSWRERARIERESEARGRAVHAEWMRSWGGTRPFDQAFTFFVIGPAPGRFRFTAAPGGGVREVVNRLTNRWVPDGFRRWVEGSTEEGYGFWADDPRPPPWEPHAYHALERALSLLACPVMPPKGDKPFTRDCDGLAKGVRDVVETLAPSTRGRLEVPERTKLRFRTVRVDGRRDLVGTVSEDADGLRLVATRRLTIRSEGAAPDSDRVEVELTRGTDFEAQLSIAYAPRGTGDEAAGIPLPKP